jgi:hypothetical protein
MVSAPRGPRTGSDSGAVLDKLGDHTGIEHSTFQLGHAAHRSHEGPPSVTETSIAFAA